MSKKQLKSSYLRFRALNMEPTSIENRHPAHTWHPWGNKEGAEVLHWPENNQTSSPKRSRSCQKWSNMIPAFADKSEGPHTQKTQNFDQNIGPKNVKKQIKSSHLRPIWPQNRHRLEKWRRSVVEKLKKLLWRPISWPKTFFFVYPFLGRFCFIPS